MRCPAGRICITELPRHPSFLAIACAPHTDAKAAIAGFFKAMPSLKTKADAAATAKLLVVLLAFAWGLNWVAAAIALREVTPWSLRVAGSSLGAALLFCAAIITGHKLHVPRREYVHVMVAGFLNVSGFQILSSFAQLSGATSRAIIITYSMPIWTM